MIRTPRFPPLLLLLAIAATVLMTFAPVVSRALQAGAGHGDAGMAMATVQTAADAPGHAPHGQHADMAVAGHRPAAPAGNDHAAHGEACDYCTMASRLLPWLALLLVLAVLRYRQRPQPVPRSGHLPLLRWPAHGARGPPLNA